MDDILKELRLECLCKSFEKENITPGIVCKLSKYDLQCLGVVNSSDMMKLRVRCIKFGDPNKSLDMRSRFEIPQTVLENLLESKFSIKDISNLLSVSERTIYRRMTQYGLQSSSFSEIDDDELDKVVEEITMEFPRCGETMLRQILSTKGVKVTRSCLRAALSRVDSDGKEERKKRRLHRRVYSVPAPNHLWHIDTNFKLIRWNFIVSGGIDGFSRYIVFLDCVDNNKAETIFSCFKNGVDNHGIPLRVRSDQGMENLKVAEFMLTARQSNSSMIVGKSTHNQRIERLWRDIYEGVLSFFYDLFYFMEDKNILDPLSDMHILALHYVYIDKINNHLNVWREAWNNHRIRTVNDTPICLFTAGLLNVPTPAVNMPMPTFDEVFDYSAEQQVDRRPTLQPVTFGFSDECTRQLDMECPRNWESVEFGIDVYERALKIIQDNN